MGKVLIFENNNTHKKTLTKWIKQIGHDATCTGSIESFVAQLHSYIFDVIVLGETYEKISTSEWIWIEDNKGRAISKSFSGYILQELFKKFRSSFQEVIIVTPYGFPAEAKFIIEHGAFDYINFEKVPKRSKHNSIGISVLMPIRGIEQIKKRFMNSIQDAFALIEQKKQPSDTLENFRKKIFGNSFPLRVCLKQIALSSKNSSNILLTGETGSGKELAANAIHENSDRAENLFVPMNCGAIPENLVESELFGAEKGAFTGATQQIIGKMELADKGTLFLDEIGDLPLAIQVKLLRAIQEQAFFRLGGKKLIKSDFRLICATNRDLNDMVEKGLFRKDLLYRIHVIAIRMPSLRERPEDIRDIAIHYINKLCEKHNYPVKTITPEFIESLMTNNWTGNVRELINTLESILNYASSDRTLHLRHLPMDIRISGILKQVTNYKIFDNNEEYEINTYRAKMRFKDETNRKNLLKRRQDYKDNSDTVQTASDLPNINLQSKLSSQILPDKQAPITIGLIKSFQSVDQIPEWNNEEKIFRKNYLEQIMKATSYHLEAAAKIYGVSKPRFYTILREHGIPTKNYPELNLI